MFIKWGQIINFKKRIYKYSDKKIEITKAEFVIIKLNYNRVINSISMLLSFC